MSASDWVDDEGNYPLYYSFGAYLRDKENLMIYKTKSNYFSKIVFPFVHSNLKLFMKVYDSLDDYTMMNFNITLRVNENIDIL